jgi:hypothetical protein
MTADDTQAASTPQPPDEMAARIHRFAAEVITVSGVRRGPSGAESQHIGDQGTSDTRPLT